MVNRYTQTALALWLLAICSTPVAAVDPGLRDQCLTTMMRAAKYFREQVAVRGGYVYYYSPDLRRRLGEGVASADQIWVQPPGTPTVGLAFLHAYRASGDKFYLDAATEVAEALIYGQLQSGGWTNCIDFNPRGERVARYRNGQGRGKDNSTLDDGATQAAIRLLMRVDRARQFKNSKVHESVQTALDALLQAQFPNGAFPQVWTRLESESLATATASQTPAKASYPEYDWRSEGRIKNYWNMYTLNDGLAGTVAETLLEAQEVYGAARYGRALRRLGDFLLLAQMPAPQPAWAQQYNYQMQPIWARKFEPPAIAGRESQDVMETLLAIHRHTRDPKYLAPLPAALKYLGDSQLPDGRLARYYELRSNRPLYMERSGDRYSLTYSDRKLPSHYGWKVASRLQQLRRAFVAARDGRTFAADRSEPAEIAAAAKRIVAALDSEGRWLSRYGGEPLVGQPKFANGESYLASAVFCANLKTLAACVAASR